MNKIIILLVLVSIGFKMAFGDFKMPSDDSMKKQWNQFKHTHSLRFNQIEEKRRFLNFRENYLKVLQHNEKFYKNETDFELALNQFSYLSYDEYVKRLGLRYTIRTDNNTSADIEIDASLNATDDDNVFRGNNILQQESLPQSVNWVTKNAVTPVKNQFSCGSCWSFSAIGVVESLYAIKYNTFKRFSEQNLIDCTYNVRGDRSGLTNYGCNGGWPERAFEYIQTYGVLEEGNYQYRAREGQCQSNSYRLASKSKIKIGGYKNIRFGDENALKKAVATIGPVAIGVDASQWSFASYSNGIYSSPRCNPNNVNHAIVVVGYGSENGRDYWLVKNSWGTSWGINGYMKLARNSGNMCGVASLATYAY